MGNDLRPINVTFQQEALRLLYLVTARFDMSVDNAITSGLKLLDSTGDGGHYDVWRDENGKWNCAQKVSP